MTNDDARTWEHRWSHPAELATWSLPEPSVREVVAGLLPARGAHRVLDLGCGIGRHALLLAKAGFDVTAVDSSPTALGVLRDASRREAANVQIHRATMTALPYPAAGFDYVLAFNAVFYAEQDGIRSAVAEIERVLKPGGLLQVTMPSRRERGRSDGWSARDLLGLFAGFEPLRLEDRPHGRAEARHWHLLAERASGAPTS